MSWIDYLFFFNLACMLFSGYVALGCFNDKNNKAGYMNLFASALNGAIFANHFF